MRVFRLKKALKGNISITELHSYRPKLKLQVLILGCWFTLRTFSSEESEKAFKILNELQGIHIDKNLCSKRKVINGFRN